MAREPKTENPHLLHWGLALAFAFLGCGGNGQGPDEIRVASVNVSPDSSTLEIGATLQLEAEVRSEQGGLLTIPATWTSSNPACATVSGTGLVTAVSEASATVFAAVGAKSGSTSIIVEDNSIPASPTDLAATPLSNTEIEVTWTDNSTNEDEFKIDREDVGAGPAGTEGGPALTYAQVGVVGANETSFRDPDLASGWSYRYQVRACRGLGCSDPSSLIAAVTTFSELEIETATLPNGLVGEPYDQALTATGGEGSPGWSMVAGSLPDGLTLSGGGTISGTPSVAGTSNFWVQVQSGDGQMATKVLYITVSWPPVSITTASMADGLVGSAYSETLAAAGGDGSFTWAAVVGSLPAGLSLNSGSGVISGTPSAAGTSNFTVRVTSGGLTAIAELSITVDGTLAITTSTLPGGTVGASYSSTLSAEGGSGGLTWSLASGTLPDGLTLSGGGTISGTPSAAGTSNFTVRVTSGGQADTQLLSLVIDPAGGPDLTNECSFPGSGWIWCDDFQADRLSSYFEYEYPGRFSRETGVGLNGSTGMQAHFTTGLVNAGNLKLAFGRTPDPYMDPVDVGDTDFREVFWRVFIRYQVGWTGGGGYKLSRGQILATPTWAQAAMGYAWSGGSGHNHLALDPASGTDEVGNLTTSYYNDPNKRWLGAQSSNTPIFDSAHVGEWYCVEVRMRLNDAGLSNGAFQLWIDGNLEAQRTGMNWVGAYDSYGINTLFLENYWNTGSPKEQYRYFDNLVVSTEPIGCGS